jgi:uncharacterized protein YkwD
VRIADRRRIAGSMTAVAVAVAAALLLAPAATSARGSVNKERNTFELGRDPAPQYGAPDVGKCTSGGGFKEVERAVAEATKDAGKPAAKADGALCAVAEVFLGWDEKAGTPRDAVLAAVPRQLGLVAPVQQALVATIPTDDARTLAEKLAPAATQFALRAPAARWGMATYRVRKGVTKVALVLQSAGVEVQPFPRSLAKGQSATLQGKVVAPYASPKVLVSDPRGELKTVDGTGDAFQAEVACGQVPGKIVVEIRGEEDGEPMVLATFPVACATDLPAAATVTPPAWPSSTAEQEKRILELVNAERTAVGLAPLDWDDAVAGVARQISEALRTGRAADVDVVQRLKAAGIASPVVVQSAAADREVGGAHERLLASPSNRANVLHADVTDAGVGVVSGTNVDGQNVVYVAEVFIRELPPVDVAKARDQLRSAVAQKRKDARTNAVTSDPTLDEVAQTWAESLAAAGGTLAKERRAELSASLDKRFRSVQVVSGAKQEILDFAEEPEVTKAARSVGVGVAQGKHPTLGRNAVYVAILLGTPRAAGDASEKPAGKGKVAAKPPAKKAGAK